MVESPAHKSSLEDPYRNDHGSGGVSLKPFEKRKRFLLGVLVRASECFDRVGRNPLLQENLAIDLRVAARSADRDRTGVGDLRHKYLLDEPLVVQFGRRERPNIDPATKHHGYICRRE